MMPKGKPRIPRVRAERVVICFSPEEVRGLKDLVANGCGQSVSDLVRTRTLTYPSLTTIAAEVSTVTNEVSEIKGQLERLTAAFVSFACMMQEQKRPKKAGRGHMTTHDHQSTH